MSESQTQIYKFGDFRVEESKRLLINGSGETVTLTPKVFDTLLYLVKNSGKIVEKDELMREIWADSIVEENNLNQNISILRRVFGEKPGEQRFIVTVAGRGYRFVPEVRSSLTSQALNEKEVLSHTSLNNKNSIAVLPFVNISNDPENEYFCDGLAEELLNALAKIKELNVAARTSSFSFKNKNINISEIGSVLKVRTILEGSVRRSGNRLRITAQLINAADGYHLWSERYDRELEDIFEVQDEITLAVTDALKVELLGKERAAVLKRFTNNPQAYELYLKGMYYRWKLEPGEFRKCGDYFHRAVEVDPKFALGYFGLASYYGYGTAWGLLEIQPEEGWKRAEAAWDKVLELDAALPEALIKNATLLVRNRQFAEAGANIANAVEANPKFPEIHHLYSFYLLVIGRFDHAVAEAESALELDPLSLIYSRFLGLCFYFARRYDAAIKQFNLALDLEPNNPSVHEILGEVYLRQEMFSEARAAWQRAAMLEGDDVVTAIFIEAGDNFQKAVRTVAQKRIERLNAKAESNEFVLAIDFVRAYVLLRDPEQAFYWLEKAIQERNVFPLLMNSDPFYDTLRSDSRFQNLMLGVGLTEMNLIQ